MSNGQEARKVIGELSQDNIDLLVRPAGLSNELEEACAVLGKKMTSEKWLTKHTVGQRTYSSGIDQLDILP